MCWPSLVEGIEEEIHPERAESEVCYDHAELRCPCDIHVEMSGRCWLASLKLRGDI